MDRLRIEVGEELQGFIHLQFGRKVSELEADSDPVLQLFALRSRVESQNANLAAASGAKTFQNLYRSCFSRAIGAKQPEDFTCMNFEINSFNRLEVPISFGQALDFDDRLINCRLPIALDLTIARVHNMNQIREPVDQEIRLQAM